MKLIFIASHGFALRMLTQTGILNKLQSNGLRVALILQNSQDEALKNIDLSNRIEIIDYDFKLSRLKSETMILKRYCTEKVINNPALREKHYKNTQAKNPLRKLKYHLYLIINKSLMLSNLVIKVINLLEKKWRKNIVNSHGNLFFNSTIISTYPADYAEFLLVKSVKSLGVRTILNLLSWDNLTAKGKINIEPDVFLSWGPIMSGEFKKLYPSYNTVILNMGVPHFDLYFNNRDINQDEKTIFFGMSSPYFAPGEIDIVEQISKWIELDMLFYKRMIIRPHPQNVIGNMADIKWIPRLKVLESSRVLIDWPGVNLNSTVKWSVKKSDMYGLSNRIRSCGLIINSCSTISIDGFCAMRPVLITGFDGYNTYSKWNSVKRIMGYEHFNKLLTMSPAVLVNNFEELFDSLSVNRLIDKVTFDKACTTYLNQQIGYTDGKSTDRIVRFYTEYAASN